MDMLKFFASLFTRQLNELSLLEATKEISNLKLSFILLFLQFFF